MIMRGSIVSVESGKYCGCRLNYVGKDAFGWHVCLNSFEVGGYVRVRRVTFVRPAAAFDPERSDDVMWNGYQMRLAQAAQFAGVV